MQSIFHKSFKSLPHTYALVKNTICRYPKDIKRLKGENDKVFSKTQLKHKIHLKLLQLSEEVENFNESRFSFRL